MTATKRGRTRSRTQQDNFLRLTDDLDRQNCSPGVGIRSPPWTTHCLPLCSAALSMANILRVRALLLHWTPRSDRGVVPARITTLFGGRRDRGQLRWKRESHVLADQI